MLSHSHRQTARLEDPEGEDDLNKNLPPLESLSGTRLGGKTNRTKSRLKWIDPSVCIGKANKSDVKVRE